MLKLGVTFNLSISLDECVHNIVIQELYGNFIKLLHFLKIFPILVACVPFQNQTCRIQLRNQQKQESFLRTSTESPSHGFSDDENGKIDFINDENLWNKSNLKAIIGIWILRNFK